MEVTDLMEEDTEEGMFFLQTFFQHISSNLYCSSKCLDMEDHTEDTEEGMEDLMVVMVMDLDQVTEEDMEEVIEEDMEEDMANHTPSMDTQIEDTMDTETTEKYPTD